MCCAYESFLSFLSLSFVVFVLSSFLSDWLTISTAKAAATLKASPSAAANSRPSHRTAPRIPTRIRSRTVLPSRRSIRSTLHSDRTHHWTRTSQRPDDMTVARQTRRRPPVVALRLAIAVMAVAVACVALMPTTVTAGCGTRDVRHTPMQWDEQRVAVR